MMLLAKIPEIIKYGLTLAADKESWTELVFKEGKYYLVLGETYKHKIVKMEEISEESAVKFVREHLIKMFGQAEDEELIDKWDELFKLPSRNPVDKDKRGNGNAGQDKKFDGG